MSMIGFDFGTTNSLVALVEGGRVTKYFDMDGLPTPSVVCYQGPKVVCGRAAKRMLTEAGLGVQGNIVKSPKMYLGKETIHVEGMNLSPIDVSSEVIRHVLDEASRNPRRRLDMSSVESAVVTIPVGMNGRARRALRDSFSIARLSINQFVHEPLAALYAWFRGQGIADPIQRYNNKLLLVVDWGGGTLDLTLCRLMNGSAVQLLNDGTDEVGGDHFDSAIRNHVLANVYRQRSCDHTAAVRPGAKARLLEICEQAKINLSSADSFQIYVPNYFVGMDDDDLHYKLSRDEFEALTVPFLDKAFSRLASFLNTAGYSEPEVSLCLVTGGMSNVPAVKSRLNQWFGPDRLRIPDDAADLIAEGAAWIAHDDVSLKLAKNVEVLLARRDYTPILRAGTPAPKGGSTLKKRQDLFCADPSYGRASIEVYAPRQAGRDILPSEPRSHLGSLWVNVDSAAKVFRERLLLDVEVDQDLVLKLVFRSSVAKDSDRIEVYSLEFSLDLDDTVLGADPNGHSDSGVKSNADGALGAVVIRPNVALTKNLSLVPGEVLYAQDRGYFDVRCRPPREQVAEHLYYLPCAGCGRQWSDASCCCG